MKQIVAVLCSVTCAAVKLSLLQENNLSNSIPHRVKCRAKAVEKYAKNYLKNAKNYFIEAKTYKLIPVESVIPHQLCFNMNLAMCNYHLA